MFVGYYLLSTEDTVPLWNVWYLYLILVHLYPSNNSRRMKSAARLPAIKWASKWLVWFQDLMLGYGFFA